MSSFAQPPTARLTIPVFEDPMKTPVSVAGEVGERCDGCEFHAKETGSDRDTQMRYKVKNCSTGDELWSTRWRPTTDSKMWSMLSER
jgi:hypothetical protein